MFDLPPLRRPFSGFDNWLADRMFGGGGFTQRPAPLDSSLPAGWTYFAQFLNHDLSGKPAVDGTARSPTLNLDCMYGGGPAGGEAWYEDPTVNYGRFRIGTGRNHYEPDLYRDLSSGAALIADPRNDETVMVGQVQLGFMLFHNKLLDIEQKRIGEKNAQAFEAARQSTIWHYQWLAVNRFLRHVADPDVISEIRCNGRPPRLKYYDRRCGAYVPLEFSAAAFRFGHSMVRDQYHLNERKVGLPLFVANPSGSEADLRGGQPLPVSWSLQWNFFLDDRLSPHVVPQHAMPIDTSIVPSLAMVPAGAGTTIRLPEVTLAHGYANGLPAGQDVANAMGLQPIDSDYAYPLWLYVLLEAEQLGGRHLGPVGSRIVAETLFGLLVVDEASYLNDRAVTQWTPLPELSDGNPDQFDLVDVFRFAGMPINGTDLQKRMLLMEGGFGAT